MKKGTTKQTRKNSWSKSLAASHAWAITQHCLIRRNARLKFLKTRNTKLLSVCASAFHLFFVFAVLFLCCKTQNWYTENEPFLLPFKRTRDSCLAAKIEIENFIKFSFVACLAHLFTRSTTSLLRHTVIVIMTSPFPIDGTYSFVSNAPGFKTIRSLFALSAALMFFAPNNVCTFRCLLSLCNFCVWWSTVCFYSYKKW